MLSDRRSNERKIELVDKCKIGDDKFTIQGAVMSKNIEE